MIAVFCLYYYLHYYFLFALLFFGFICLAENNIVGGGRNNRKGRMEFAEDKAAYKEGLRQIYGGCKKALVVFKQTCNE